MFKQVYFSNWLIRKLAHCMHLVWLSRASPQSDVFCWHPTSGGCGSGVWAGCPLVEQLKVRMPAPPVCKVKNPWAWYTRCPQMHLIECKWWTFLVRKCSVCSNKAEKCYISTTLFTHFLEHQFKGFSSQKPPSSSFSLCLVKSFNFGPKPQLIK